MRNKIIWIAIGSALLGGCAVGPDFKAPQPALPEHWRDSTVANDAIEQMWWKQFHDATLDDLVARALSNNANVQLAMLRVAQSRVLRNADSGAFWPNVNAKGAYQRERQSELGTATRMIDLIAPAGEREQIVQVLSEPFDVFQAGFDVGWELDLWGRLRRTVEASDANVRSSEQDLRDAQLSLIGEVVRGYLELRGAQDQLRIATADAAAGQDLVELTEYRVKGGLVDQLDLATQRARLADTRSTLPQLKQQETQLLSALAVLLNEPPGSLDTQLTAAPPTFTLPPAVAGGVPSEVARRRPDIQRAEAQLHAATAEIGIAVADLYPRITLTGSFVQESLRASDLGDWGARQWSVGPSISLPIFDGGRRRAVVEVRKLDQQQAAVSYQQTVLRAWHEIETALSGYSAEQEHNRELSTALTASRDAYDIARVRYNHGMINYLGELEARRTLLQTERAYSQSNIQLGTQLVAVYKALGGGWPQ
ncbi:efflux transporter outer membrane subunit [Peristeroidobacter soli]|uniref:efflux transporter outer membrane subunit n=1 Tax=Peristeroidobacter soli TaxID=2497877 RepID=UPI00101BD757|nr:efflux transporter outer membrane subunit [Peristeroidobacter soli]